LFVYDKSYFPDSNWILWLSSSFLLYLFCFHESNTNTFKISFRFVIFSFLQQVFVVQITSKLFRKPTFDLFSNFLVDATHTASPPPFCQFARLFSMAQPPVPPPQQRMTNCLSMLSSCSFAHTFQGRFCSEHVFQAISKRFDIVSTLASSVLR
jgi:hypothetical protein